MRRRQVGRASLLERVSDMVVVLFVLFSTLPVFWLFLTSLKPEGEIVRKPIRYLPDRITFEHYAGIWHQSAFPNLLLNSAITTGLTVAICLVTGTIAAYAFSRCTFPGRSELLAAHLVVGMFPAILMIIPLFVLIREVGLLDTSLGLALAYTSFLLPLFVWIMKGFFDAAPPELENAARIDGCTRIGAMARVVFPVARNGVLATTVFVAIASWNEFLFALMLTTSSGRGRGRSACSSWWANSSCPGAC
jgi:multiple sugar transport system permease protein